MRDVAAIVAPAVDLDQVTREIIKEHIALQDDERNADAHERKSVGFRESAARRRVEIGRRLIAAKNSGEIKHGQWLPYLEKLGIDRRNATNWMALAGYVEQSNGKQADDVSHSAPAPTLADAGIDKRPRKRDAMPTPDPEPPPAHVPPPQPQRRAMPTPMLNPAPAHVPPPLPSTPTLDISRDLAKLTDKICTFAESLADKRYRALVANQLRETARLIEEMP